MSDDCRVGLKSAYDRMGIHHEKTAVGASKRCCRRNERKGKEDMAKMIKSLKMRAMYVLHFALVTAVMLVVWFTKYAPAIELADVRTVNIAVCACYIIVSVFLYRTYNAYKVGMYRIGEAFYAQSLANLFANAITYVFACIIQMKLLNVLPVLLAFAIQSVISGFWCLAANTLYFSLHKPRKTFVIYKDDADLGKIGEIVHFEKRFEIDGKIQNPQDIFEILPLLDGYQAVVVSGIEATLRNGIVKACIDKDIDCYFIPHTGDVIISGAKHIQSFSVPIMRARRAVLRPEYAFAKRTLDILLAALALVVASPFMAVTAIAIKLYDHGPALYKQVRLTKDGREFEILKFRSMRVDAEKDGVARLAAEHDNRITPVGKVIRAIRFDELPQIFNILKGDMSIVGPRPERPEIAAQYEQEMPAFSLRLQVKAGLTGMAQVYGKYNTEPRDKLKMDLMYINDMSLMQDLKLIFATVRILFMKDSTEGVQQGQVTASKQELDSDKSA